MVKYICSLVSFTNDTLTLTNSNNIFRINLANRQKTLSLSPSSDCWGVYILDCLLITTVDKDLACFLLRATKLLLDLTSFSFAERKQHLRPTCDNCNEQSHREDHD